MLNNIIMLSILMLFLSCATPVQPTGGPADREPPKILSTFPESGTTNFKDSKVEFVFSEFVDRNSFRTALNIEPDLGLEYTIKWKRKKAIVSFDEPLPDSTTVIITLGTQFADVKRNNLPIPETIALSTGSEIDSGELTGFVLDAETGKGNSGERVLLYKVPYDLSQRADYVAETDTSGAFTFSYLGEGTYKAFYVEDRNRNKTWEMGSESAQAFDVELIEIQKEQRDTLGTAYTVIPDTLSPRLQGVGLFSSQRMRFRFSEEIGFADTTSITILDSLGNPYSDAYVLYRDQNEPFVLYAQSNRELPAEQQFSFSIDGITDAANNHVLESDVTINGSNQADTTLQRIIGQQGENGLFPDQALEIVFAAPITDQMIVDSTTVIIGEISDEEWGGIRTENNKLIIAPTPEWVQGVNYQFLIWNPLTLKRTLVEPDIWQSADYGEIEVTHVDSTTSDAFSYVLASSDGQISNSGSLELPYVFKDLPPLRYKLIIYSDENGNGIWDRGSVEPYRKPEPYFIRNPLPVTGGFTSEVAIDLK